MPKAAVLLVLILLLPLPIPAADWDFYGSQRMATFWNSNDYGDLRVNGQGDDEQLIWDFMITSRLGAKVRTEDIKAQVELALFDRNGLDGRVLTRRAYAEWKFMSGGRLKVGKDFTPLNQLISGQVFDGDIGLSGIGCVNARRAGEVALQLGDFEIAAVSPYSAAGPAGGDADMVLPKIEASYAMAFGFLQLKPAAGFQYYRIQPNGGAVTDDLDIIAYMLTFDAAAVFGPYYVKTAAAWGRNWASANWNTLGGYTSNSNAAALLNAAGDGIKDCTSWQAALIAGVTLSDRLRFEAAGGYRSDKNEAFTHRDGAWMAYVQSVLTLAPGVFLVPEIGYYNYLENNAGLQEGYEWYAGAKWQIDF